MTTNQFQLDELEAECNRLRKELSIARHHLQCVNDVVRDISSLLDLDQILAVVAEKARQLIGAEKMIVPIVDDERKMYTYMAASGNKAQLILGQSFPINIGMCGWVLSNCKPLFFGENSQELMGKNIRWTPGMESALLVPLMSRGNIVGGLSGLGKADGGSFTKADQSLLELFSWHISIAIENAMIFKQLKNQKSQLQSILDNTPAIIYIKDTAGKYLLVNKRYENLFKHSHKSVIGQTDFDIFSHANADIVTRNDQQVLTTKAALEVEETLTQADGEHIYLSVKFPLLDINNNIYAMCGISTDITEHRKTEVVLRRAQKMEAIGQLSGGIAHDFNNQLGVVIGYLDMINHTVGSQSGVARMIETATRATMRCTDLTKQLLAFSRKQTIDDQTLALNACFVEMNMLFMRSLTPMVNIEYDLPSDLWPIRTNKGELQDAMLNLVLNAGDAMGNGGHLKICAENVLLDAKNISPLHGVAAGSYVKLSVTDTGVGMTGEVLEKIYEPFFTTKEVGKGTGLGMSMVYGYIKRNKGQITIESSVGQGTSVNLYLPKAVSREAVATIAQPDPVARATGNEQILVVDDEPALLELTVMYLQHLGYATLHASNAYAAMEIVKTTPGIRLLLTDIVMPGMNGYQLANSVREMNPDIKVLLISGYIEKQSMNDASYKKYESSMLLKPYRKEGLATKMREVLDRDS